MPMETGQSFEEVSRLVSEYFSLLLVQAVETCRDQLLE